MERKASAAALLQLRNHFSCQCRTFSYRGTLASPNRAFNSFFSTQMTKSKQVRLAPCLPSHQNHDYVPLEKGARRWKPQNRSYSQVSTTSRMKPKSVEEEVPDAIVIRTYSTPASPNGYLGEDDAPKQADSSAESTSSAFSKTEEKHCKLGEKATEAMEEARVSASSGGTNSIHTASTALLGEQISRIDSRVWPIAASAMMMGSAIGVVIPVMPLFAREIGLSNSDFGLVISVLGLTRLLLNVPMAAIGDSLGRRPLLICGPLATSAAMVGTGFSSTLSELLGWRFITGAAGAAQMTGAQLYLSDISTSANRARTMAPMLAAWSAGVTVGPAAGGILAEHIGLGPTFMCVGAAVAAVAVNNLRLPETRSPDLTEQVEPRRGRAVLSQIRTAKKQWKELLSMKDVRAAVYMHMAYWFCTSGAQFTILPLLATDNFNMSPGSVGTMFAVMAAINIIGSQPAAYLSDKFGRKKAMIPGALTVGIALGLIPFATEYYELMSLVSLWGLGACIWGTTPSAYIVDITTNENRSQALAMLRSAGDLGLMLGAGLTGFLSDMVGMNFAMGLNCSLLVLAASVFGVKANEPNILLQIREEEKAAKAAAAAQSAFKESRKKEGEQPPTE